MPQLMKAAVVHSFGQPLTIEDVPVPVPGPGEVLVKIVATGVCHTDLHAADGDWPVKPTPPFTPGHEGAGYVVALGAGVTSLKEGDPVGIAWLHDACGACEHCMTGWETLCEAQHDSGYSVNGSFAEYAIGSAFNYPQIGWSRVRRIAAMHDVMDAPRDPGPPSREWPGNEREVNMTVRVIGIDIAKRWFQIHGVDGAGAIVLRRKISRDSFLKLIGALPPCVIGMEAGSGAHHWARQVSQLGHQVRLMPPQFVRPYVKTNKNDAADAEACCEAVQRPGMRFVPMKTIEQQTAVALHRVRDHLVRQRTGTINALRGHLAEYGVVAPQMRTGLKQLFNMVLDDDDRSLSAELKPVLRMLVEEIQAVDERIAELDRRMKDAARANEACRRLVEVPGIGPLIATAVVAAVPDDDRFSSGRHFASWVGLTPRQHSSGGKERLLGISKRGDAYLRRQLVNGARSLVRIASGRTGHLWDWINALMKRRAFNVVTVAVANKLARIAWAIQARGTRWQMTEAT